MSHPRAFTSADDHQCLGHHAFRHIHPKSFCFIFRVSLLLPVKLDWSYLWPLLQASQIPIRHPWPQPGLIVRRRCPGSWRPPLQKVLDSDRGALTAVLSSVPRNPALLCDLRSSVPQTASVYWGSQRQPLPWAEILWFDNSLRGDEEPSSTACICSIHSPQASPLLPPIRGRSSLFFLLQSLKLPEDRALSCA